MTLTCVILQVLGKLSTDHLNRVVPDMATCYITNQSVFGEMAIWGNGTDFEI